MAKGAAKREEGAALLTVLMLVAVMAIISAAALERLTLATRLTANAGAVDQARAYADAAEQVATTRITDLIALQPGRTTLRGGWLNAPQSVPVPSGTAIVRMNDGGNCFNLNSLVVGEDESDLKVRPIGITQFVGLMQALGIDPRAAQGVAIAAADWIDTDSIPQPGGAEDESYIQLAQPYRTPNRFMTDASELRAVRGVTPAIYDVLRPWICALPTASLSPINVNTLTPAQAPLVAMLLPGKISLEQARQYLAQRPPDGYGGSRAFWAGPARSGITPDAMVGEQVQVKTRYFRAAIAVNLGGIEVNEGALIDAQEAPARLIRRYYGDPADTGA